jgi:hypothetical protein
MVTGKASAAKAALGDEPVFAYIASLPSWRLARRRGASKSRAWTIWTSARSQRG